MKKSALEQEKLRKDLNENAKKDLQVQIDSAKRKMEEEAKREEEEK